MTGAAAASTRPAGAPSGRTKRTEPSAPPAARRPPGSAITELSGVSNSITRGADPSAGQSRKVAS